MPVSSWITSPLEHRQEWGWPPTLVADGWGCVLALCTLYRRQVLTNCCSSRTWKWLGYFRSLCQHYFLECKDSPASLSGSKYQPSRTGLMYTFLLFYSFARYVRFSSFSLCMFLRNVQHTEVTAGWTFIVTLTDRKLLIHEMRNPLSPVIFLKRHWIR